MTNAIARKIISAALAISTLGGTQAITFTAAIGTTVAASTLAATPAEAAGQCGARLQMQGVEARGAVYQLRKNRAERRAKRAWRAYVAGQDGVFAGTFVSKGHASFGLGSRYADLDNARNVVMDCKGAGIARMQCTVTATPCAAAQAAPARNAQPRQRTQTEEVVLSPDFRKTWHSDFGPIHWKQGFYGNPTKTLTGDLDYNKSENAMVYVGQWGRTDSAARGTVRFVFTHDGKRFTGTYRASDGSTKTWNGFQ